MEGMLYKWTNYISGKLKVQLSLAAFFSGPYEAVAVSMTASLVLRAIVIRLSVKLVLLPAALIFRKLESVFLFVQVEEQHYPLSLFNSKLLDLLNSKLLDFGV